MEILVDEKTNMAKCPHCGEWCNIIRSEAMNQIEFACCKSYLLDSKIKGK